MRVVVDLGDDLMRDGLRGCKMDKVFCCFVVFVRE